MGITWLASYPKSGNTWMRVFLANYWQNAAEPVDINDMPQVPVAAARPLLDNALGIESGHLTPAEIDRLRPEVYRQLVRQASAPLYFKLHDAYRLLPDHTPLIPPDITDCVIYIVRNPLDVVVSLADHNGISIDAAINQINNRQMTLANSVTGQADQVPQVLFSWSEHVQSWHDAPNMTVHVVRYEDMLQQPFTAFAGVIRALSEPCDGERIRRAIRFSHFDEMARQEGTAGFRERSPHSARFFRRGQVGSGHDSLSPEQRERVITAHRAMMTHMGYL